MEGHEPLVRIEGLRKTCRGGVEALRGIDLELRAGELFCLLGPNGAGKTTLISTLFGVHQPAAGRATVCGHDVSRESLAARQRMAFLPGQVVLYRNLTALQNVMFFAELGGVRERRRERCLAALERTGLTPEQVHRRVGTFSKGMRQKVALAGALVRECPVIVLDEPTSGLDPPAASELMNLLQGQARRGCLVFLSTHDIFRVDQIADRVGILHGGRLVRLFPREGLGTGRLLEEYVALISVVPGRNRPAPVTGSGPGASHS